MSIKVSVRNFFLSAKILRMSAKNFADKFLRICPQDVRKIFGGQFFADICKNFADIFLRVSCKKHLDTGTTPRKVKKKP